MTEQRAILPTTPLTGLRCVVLDTETTGLQVDRARIISVGAVCIDGTEIEAGTEQSFLINPGESIPEASSKIHGLYDSDIRDAGHFQDVISPLLDAIVGRVVVGHNIGFDLAILAHEHRRAAMEWAAPPALDTGLLARAVNPHLPDGSLETVAAWLDVEIVERHTALGDARTAAQIYLQLVPKLMRAGVRSFAEADRYIAERNGDAHRQHQAAGWEMPRISDATPDGRMDMFIYRNMLSDLMRSPPVFVAPEMTALDAISTMNEAGIGALLIGDSADPVGIVTERDIVRLIAQAGSSALSQPVSEAMSSPVVTLPASSPVYRAVARLQRLGFRHIPATDAQGLIAGVVSARDLLRRSASAALVLGDEIAMAETTPALARAFAQLPEAVRKLRAEELAPLRITGLISEEVRAMTARAAELAIRELQPAPAAWSLMVLGSAGRGESLLVPDQDNALIFEDRPGMADWAASYGQRVNEILDAAGIPLCKGGVMAGRPEWRHTPAEWRNIVAGWIGKTRPTDLLNVDIFFDFQHVAGTPELTDSLFGDALSLAQRAPTFIRAINGSVAQLQTPVGLFGRLRATNGAIDIKAGGLLPVVAFARAVALHHGIVERATAARLKAAVEMGGVPEGDGGRLIEMHREFVALAMDQQLADIGAGHPPSYRLELKRLDRATRRALAGQLSDLDDILSLAWSTLSA
ncbi:MAG: CBS domain-containing protein [Alphaproteobacteria bacterium]